MYLRSFVGSFVHSKGPDKLTAQVERLSCRSIVTEKRVSFNFIRVTVKLWTVVLSSTAFADFKRARYAAVKFSHTKYRVIFI